VTPLSRNAIVVVHLSEIDQTKAELGALEKKWEMQLENSTPAASKHDLHQDQRDHLCDQ
jgi:hypothetical protein